MTDKPTYEELEQKIREFERIDSRRKKVNENLDEGKFKHETFVNNIPGMVYRAYPDWSSEIISGGREVSGYYSYELNSMESNWLNIIHPDDKDHIFKESSILLKERKSIVQTYRIVSKDGDTRWVEDRKTSIFSKNKDFLYIDGIVFDITDRKQAEEALSISLQFERIVSKISSKLAGMNSKKEIDEEINKALALIGEFSGADRAYVFLFRNENKIIDNTHEWCRANIQPEIEKLQNISIDKELPWLSRQINEQEIFHVPDVLSMPPEAGLEQKHFIIQGIKSLIAVPMRLGSKLIGFLGFDAVGEHKNWNDNHLVLLKIISETFANVIQRNRSEEKLKRIQSQLSNAIEIAHLGPWEYDVDTDLFTFNDYFYKIFRTTAGEVGGYKMKSEEYAKRFLHPDDIPMVREETIKTILTTDPDYSNQVEHRVIFTDGTVGHIIVRIFIVKDDNGKTIKTYGVNQDITELKQAEERLRESEEKLIRSKKMESLGLLAGGVAHDLNNVLSGIVSFPELLLLDLPKGSKYRKSIQTIQDSGERAAAIVQDLLTIARGVATPTENLNLNDIIKEYKISPEYNKLRQYHPAVTIKTDMSKDLMNISGSPIHIRKVIMNLVSNASEAIEGRGNVNISTMNRYVDRPIKGYDDVKIGEYAVLKVSDDGSGILPEHLERIFEPFFTKKVMGRSGTGLGLAVVWNIVQDHEGYIDVINTEEGTTFEIYFPIVRDKKLFKDIQHKMEDFKGNGESVLVVDDEESQREITCQMLDKLGYKAEAVSSGEEAVAFLREKSMDIILLDMIMDPGINGREAYEKILEISPHQKAIIVSGYAETQEVKKTQRLGAGRYVKKPLTLQTIGEAIKEELKKS